MNAFARVTKHPSAILLVVQLLSVMAYPFMEDTAVGRAAFGVLGVVVLGVAVWAVRSTPALTWSSCWSSASANAAPTAA